MIAPIRVQISPTDVLKQLIHQLPFDTYLGPQACKEHLFECLKVAPKLGSELVKGHSVYALQPPLVQ